MSRGDYQVRVHVIEARELKGREGGGMSDPVAFVTCFGKKQHTDVHKKTLNCVFDHLLFFENKITREEFLHSRLSVAIYDANSFRRDVLIGAYEFDLAFVYNRKGHELYRKWVALTDVTDEFEGIQGYLKLSITALGPGEMAPAHEEGDEDDEGEGDASNLQAMVLMPPTIKTEEYHLFVKCYKAEDLPKMDKLGKCDPFCQVQFGGTKEKTKMVKGSLSPTWNQEIQVPVVVPSMSDRIAFTVWDWDKAAKDDLIFTTHFSFQDILRTPKPPFWINLYGSKDTDNGKVQLQMNSASMEGTWYRGRILLGLATSKVEAGKLAVNDTSGATEPKPVQFSLLVDLYEGTELEGGSLDVEVSMGKVSVKSKKVDVKGKTALWYESLPEIKIAAPEDPSQIPDILIHLISHGLTKKRLGYLRLKATDVMGFDHHPLWYQLKPNPECDELGDEDIAGFVMLRLGFGQTAKAPKGRASISRPPRKNYEFRAHIYQARNLPAADEVGTSDPYVVVRLGSKRGKSQRRDATLFPQWYETVKFDVELPDPLDYAPAINLLVYDWDKVTADDLLGRCQVPVSHVRQAFPEKPQWYPLYMDDPTATQGEILASFQLIPKAEVNLFPAGTIRPQFKDCIFEIQAVGVRQLLPQKMIAAQNPYLEFDTGTRGTKGGVIRTKACDDPEGANANHLEVLKLPVKLPLDPLFCPYVNVRCIDYRLGGVSTPLLGAASIPIAPFLPWGEGTEVVQEESAEYKAAVAAKAEEAALIDIDAEVDAGAGVPGLADDEQAPLIGPDSELSDVYQAQKDGGPTLFDLELQKRRRRVKKRKNPVPKSRKHITEVYKVSNVRELGEELGLNARDVARLLYPILLKNAELEKAVAETSLQRTIGDVGPTSLCNSDGYMEEEGDDDSEKKQVMTELEKHLELPFHEFPLFRGRTHGLSALEKKLAAKTGGTTIRKAGAFKGNFRVLEAGLEKLAKPAPDLRTLYKPKPVIVRVYVLRGRGLVPYDPNGFSDPYIKIICGRGKHKKEIDDREGVQKKTLNPDFYKCHEMEVMLPGQSDMNVEVWDWDMTSGDDLIGVTTIDLENRWFSDEWNAIKPRPVESRTLWNPASSNPQGILELYVDMLTPADARKTPQDVIAPEPPKKCELRVIIWNTKDVVFKDKAKSDIFVTGTIEGTDKRLETDTHWNSDDGRGMFNWRFKFDVEIPSPVSRLKLQIWDKDLLNPNDAIAEANLNLKGFFKKFAKGDAEVQKLPKQWITMTHPNFEGPQGKAEVEVHLLTEHGAASLPAGLGRDEPNENPHLPPPKRPETSFNPFRIDKILAQKWRRYRWYLYGCLLLVLVLFLLKFLN